MSKFTLVEINGKGKGKSSDIAFKVAVLKNIKGGAKPQDAFKAACTEFGKTPGATMVNKNASSLVWGYKQALTDKLSKEDKTTIELCTAAGLITAFTEAIPEVVEITEEAAADKE